MGMQWLFIFALFIGSPWVWGAGYSPPDPYDLNISETDARSVLNLILEDLRYHPEGYQKPDAEGSLYAQRLLGAYRFNGDSTDLAIKDAPFPLFLVGMQMDPLYEAAYKDSYPKEYDRVVAHTSVEIILDGFMEAILSDTLPPVFKDQGDQVGKCLAKKVLHGNRLGCVLDPKDGPPSIFAKAFVKLSCPLGLASDCYSRQVVYRSAKDQLTEALANKEIRELIKTKFNEKFPTEFRTQFLAQLSQQIAGFPSLIQKKFGADDEIDAWTKRGRLFEADIGATVSLPEICAGIRADLGVAALLVKSKEPRERSLGAALFFGAANRFIIVMGGKAALLKGDGIEITGYKPLNPLKPEIPQGAPIPALASFGGWSARKDGSGALFGPWDFQAYDPTKQFQVFPSVFKLEKRGIAWQDGISEPFETLDDIGELVYSSLDFLRQTRSEGTFGKYFGGQDIAKIVDPTSPVIFPSDGRKLVMGILGGALKNIKAPVMGHIEPIPGQLLVFHDKVSISARDNTAPTVRSVAHLLGKAADFGLILTGDPDVPADLLAAIPDVEVAVQAGMFVLGSKGQAQDGGFNETMGSGPNNGEIRTLKTNIAGMTTLTRIYNRTHTIVFRLQLREGWKFFDRFWPDQNFIPRETESGVAQPLSPVEAWALVRLWNETQILVRPDLGTEVEWAHWQKRFDELRNRLMAQLQTDNGPEYLKP